MCYNDQGGQRLVNAILLKPYPWPESDRLVGGYILWLRFRDGTAGEVDLSAAQVAA